MGPLTRTGKRLWLLFTVLSITISATYAQTSPAAGRCAVTSVPAQARAEGLTELLGDILIQCSGSTPGAVLTGNLTVALPVSVTNRVDSANLATASVVFADLGTGFTPLPNPAQIVNNLVVVNGLNITVPASGSYALRISNVRGNVSAYGSNPALSAPINAQLSFTNGSLPVNQSSVTVANVEGGLLATLFNRGSITCSGSPVPSTISLPSLFSAGTFFTSTRVTEGFASAFQAKGPGEDSGTRFLLRFSGAPAGMRFFVPDYVAGSSAATQTAGGDMGVAQSGGAYVPGSGTLLLARVLNADTNGAGGTVLPVPTGSGAIALTTATEVGVAADGSAYAVFEVLDAQASRQESAQIPVFIGMGNVTATATVQETLSIAPLSNVTTASVSAPLPRFSAAIPAGPDCTAVGDCTAGYYPNLSVQAAPIQFTAVAGGAVKELWGYVQVGNTGGGFMPWTATIQYQNGSGWAFLDYSSGVNDHAIRVTADAKGLAAGTYKANLVVTAGGQTATVPITLTVSAAPAGSGTTTTGTGTGSTTTGTGTGSTAGTGTSAPPPAAPSVAINRIVNAATFEATPLVAGSIGTVMGANLAGKNVTVTLDGLNADLLYTSANQINLVVPAGLRGKNSATMVATVDGVSSAPQTVILAPAWPAVFAHGVLNQDNSVNGVGAAAGSGSILQIYATGIPDGATVSVQIAGRKDLIPLYAAAAPNVPGVQQVNVAVPDGVDPGAAPLVVCASTGGQSFCSPAFTLAVQ
jgi:uncharacterized protein (TIGR03437 family)